eukprot:GHRQ01016390.1.p3 GENE.GHRQ01016390.1~~GHRQ01016390.1.p3  ORF type:complete len:131 (-),score=27.29 GHRQ01016390.1:1443-1835(-)
MGLLLCACRVSTHRYHHMHCDTPLDPHSPYEGLFWSHMGWLFSTEASMLDYSNADDLKAQWFYRCAAGVQGARNGCARCAAGIHRERSGATGVLLGFIGRAVMLQVCCWCVQSTGLFLRYSCSSGLSAGL